MGDREKRLASAPKDRALDDELVKQRPDEHRAARPGKRTLIEQQRAEGLAEGSRSRSAVGRRTLIEQDSHPSAPAPYPSMTDLTVSVSSDPRSAFDDFRSRGLREVLAALGSMHCGRGLMAATLSVARKLTRPALSSLTVRAAPPDPTGQAMWRAAERRAATLYRHAEDNGDVRSEDPAVEEALLRAGGGQPLPAAVRRRMELELGMPLGRVRVHVDAVAAAATRAVRARAFTVGEDIFFADGAYAPETPAGQRLLVHELTHVVQAYQGRTETGGAEIKVSSRDESLEHEAEAVAGRIGDEHAAPTITALEGAEKATPNTDDKWLAQLLPEHRGTALPYLREIEASFGEPLGHVEAHTGMAALAPLGARALAVGSVVAFAEDRPSAALVAHETAHVLQNRRAGSATPTSRVVSARGSSAEAEADAVEAHVEEHGIGSRLPPVQASPDARVHLSPMVNSVSDRKTRLTAPITHDGYVTYAIPVEGGQQLILQLYRLPGALEGVLLRFKSSKDPRAPQETPIPVGASYAPTLRTQTSGRILLELGEPGRNVEAHYAAGSEVVRYHAINAENPFGPLLMNREFSRLRFLEAVITHPGGFDRYSFREDPSERLPDEAIAAPTWQPYVHPRLGLSYRAVRGRYVGRSVTIDYGEVATSEALEEGFKETGKLLAEALLLSVPYVGPLILIGQALAGRTIWGDRLSVEGRVLYGLFALLPVAWRLHGAAGSSAELTAARDLAAAHGISESEALTLIKGVQRLSAQERSFIETAEQQIRSGRVLTEEQSRQLAVLVKRIGSETELIFSAANDIEMIWQSQRYWGQTEGAVYGARMPADTLLQRLKSGISQKQGMVIFQGDAARLFHAHEVEGGYSALKRLLGQHKAGFGDIVFDEAVKEGSTISVTRAHLATAPEVQHMGQSTSWAMARLWGRRLTLEPLAAAGVASAGYWVYMIYDWITEEREARAPNSP